MNNIQISKNFKLKEFECSDSDSVVKLEGYVRYLFRKDTKGFNI